MSFIRVSMNDVVLVRRLKATTNVAKIKFNFLFYVLPRLQPIECYRRDYTPILLMYLRFAPCWIRDKNRAKTKDMYTSV